MAFRIKRAARWPIAALVMVLGLVTSATPAPAAEGSGTGAGVYETTYQQITGPLCRKFTSLTYTGYFDGSYTAADPSDPARVATYDGDIQVQLRSLDTFWYENPEGIFLDPQCTTRRGGIDVAWSVMKAPGAGAPGNVQCQFKGRLDRNDSLVTITGTGDCQVSDSATNVTVTQSPTRETRTMFLYACERVPPTEHHSTCQSIDSFVATDDVPTP